MKRVALFINSLQKGGSERVMVNLAEDFLAKGYEVVLVTQYKRETEYEISGGIKRVYSEPEEERLQGGRIHNFLERFCTLRNIWKTYRPDVILSFLGKNNLMAILTSAFLPVKTAVSVRGEPTMEYEGKKMQMLTKWLFRYADGVILQTRQARDFFPKGVRKKAVILPNPLNPLFLRERYTGQKENIIAAAGRLDENKNHAMLIRTFSLIEEEFPKMKLVIYGEGESRGKLERLIEEKHLQEKVSLPGSVSDVASHIENVRIFTLTSNTEGMPNSVIEAMCLGLPVIATDCPCGGTAELIEDGKNGLLVPVGDEKALAEAMKRILSNPELEKRLGEEAYLIQDRMEPAKVCRLWEEYLCGL
ncbi:MAG: glycosyltransferase [Lachnospiraceae bacterium]|nr:glycosyltransferase [Lachnospiraceae bacterium]